jgi:cell division protein FtsA
MSKKNFETYIDLGSSKVRTVCFDKVGKNQFFFLENNCFSSLKSNQLNLTEIDKTIEEIITKVEKKTGEYLNNVSLMLDTSDAFSITLSVSKKNEKKFITKEDVQYLIQDAKQQILNSYSNKSIIHIIVNNYKIDNTDYETLPKNLECKKFSIDIIFICFPKDIIMNLEKLFNKHQIIIDRFISTSYAKSFNYKKHFTEFSEVAFLDIGYEKTSVILYNKEILKFFNVLPIGGHHITKDISKVLDLKIDLSEKIKSNLNKDIIFSENEKNDEIFEKEFLNNIKGKELPIELIKKIIFARVEETLNLCLKMFGEKEYSEGNNELKIILIGEGAKILNNKYIDIKETIPLVNEINFFEESTPNICESGLKMTEGINKQEVLVVPKRLKKKGLFERLFYFFK